MLEYFYKQKRTLADFRRGPLGPCFDGFAANLKKGGYCYSRAKTLLGRACQFNYFLIDQGITDVKQVAPALIEPFIKIYLRDFRTACGYGDQLVERIRSEMKRLFAYLAAIKAIEVLPLKSVVKPYSWMLEPYLKYLRQDCELIEVTIQRKRQILEPFLEGLGKVVRPSLMKSLRAEAIEAYIKRHLKDSRSNFQVLICALRGFLGFCAREGFTSQDLSGVIPSVPHYRMATLPKGMEDSAIELMLAAVPKDTPIGRRDYAVMLLLMAYGIRGKQAAELVLEDINWPRSLIRIRPQKGGKEAVLPLMQAVGEAILAYLRDRPQDAPFRQVFLTTRAPLGPLTGLKISGIIRHYVKKVGLKVPGCGAHTLRHSWAIRALAHDAPMKAIADVMGHRHLDTTFIYAKADLKTLRQVAMPWPETSR